LLITQVFLFVILAPNSPFLFKSSHSLPPSSFSLAHLEAHGVELEEAELPLLFKNATHISSLMKLGERGKEEETLLAHAVSNNLTFVVRGLLSLGVDPNVCKYLRCIALFIEIIYFGREG
jgi:hypothetical protein